MSNTIESPYRAANLPKLPRRHLYLEYKGIGETHFILRWVLWGLGFIGAMVFTWFFIEKSFESPEVQRMAIALGSYWMIWSLRYTKIVLR